MNPFSLIQNAYMGAAPGVFANSTNYNNSTFVATTVQLKAGQSPSVTALETDNLQMVADAAQWNFAHQTNNASATIPPQLLNTFFQRVGTQFQNGNPLDFGGSTYTNLQLSFRDNAGTRGDAQGTIPVIQWTGSFTGAQTLYLTFKMPGRYLLGLRCDTGSAVSMYQMELIVV